MSLPQKVKQREWYGVKLLYQIDVKGKPIKEFIDRHYKDNYRCFEESVLLVGAKSPSDAERKAIKKAKKQESRWINIYGQHVTQRLVHCNINI